MSPGAGCAHDSDRSFRMSAAAPPSAMDDAEPIDGSVLTRALSAAKSCGSLSRRSRVNMRSSVTRRRPRAARGTSAVGVAGCFAHEVITRFRKGILRVGGTGCSLGPLLDTTKHALGHQQADELDRLDQEWGQRRLYR